MPEIRAAIDIGGTFTDTVLMRGNDEVLATAKTLTTHGDPATGALQGLRRVLEDSKTAIQSLTGLVHGTTLATNALIERRGACVATITTEGFRDILEIAYERRYDQYDINLEKPDLIVPRSRAFTVSERMSVRGEVLTPLDEAALDGLVTNLDACGAEAVAICLLHAYSNPSHEERLAALLSARRPDLAISVSSQVSPEAREFDRLCTALANAYIQPLMAGYLASFERQCREEGLTCPILMMTAGGGMTTLETAARFPIRLVESGPAGGAILAARVAQGVRAEQVLSFDMGGTTAKLCLIDGYRPQTARNFEIARAARFIKGSGMPVRIPVVEMIEIGAGGGSIAGVDRLGRLTVGPESAGSEPGPAAFGRGGARATVTDADVTLGLIDPNLFAEGRLQVDQTAAAMALARDVGAPLDIDPQTAAQGVSEIVDEAMASAARMHAVESGKDLGTRTMIAFGGNGPLHATRVARRAGVGHIIIPPDPGVGSAVGFLYAPIAFEIVRSLHMMLDGMELDTVNGLLADMASEARTVVMSGAPVTKAHEVRTAFMRYRGQGHEIEILIPARDLNAADLCGLRTAFEAEYARQFTRAVPGMEIEILNWAVRVATPESAPESLAPAETTGIATGGQDREIICDVTGVVRPATVFQRAQIKTGTLVTGPALIVEPQTTTFLSAGWTAVPDQAGNLHLMRRDVPGEDPGPQPQLGDLS